MRLSRNQSLDDHVVYSAENDGGVDAVLGQKLFEGSDAPFVAYVVPICVYVFNLIGGILVDGIVGEVHETVGLVVASRDGLGRGCEAHQALFLNLDFQRVYAGDYRLDAQVELEVVDQQRVGDILRDDEIALVGNLIELVGQKDASAPALASRFDDLHLGGVPVHFVGQGSSLGRQNLGGRSKVEMLVAVLLLHALDVPLHLVFARQFAAFGEVVDLLPAVKHALLLVA